MKKILQIITSIDVRDSEKLIRDTDLIEEPKNPKKIFEAGTKLLNKSEQSRRKLSLKTRQRIIKIFLIDQVFFNMIKFIKI